MNKSIHFSRHTGFKVFYVIRAFASDWWKFVQVPIILDFDPHTEHMDHPLRFQPFPRTTLNGSV